MEEKYYYAQVVDPELSVYDIYYCEENAKEDNITIYGNRDFASFNDINYRIFILLDELGDEIETILDRYEDGDFDEEDDPEEALNVAIKNAAKQHIRYQDFDTNHIPTDRELNYLCRLASRYLTIGDDDQLLVAACKIIFGEDFSITTLRGYSQSDWMKCLYPVRLESRISLIEAIYFGTGTEFRYLPDKVTLEEFNDSDNDYDYIYTELYNTKDIKKYLAGVVFPTATTEQEIKLLDIDGSEIKY